MRIKIIENPFLDWYRITYLYWKRKEINKYLSAFFKDNIAIDKAYDGCHYHRWHDSMVCIFSEEEYSIKVVIHEITHAVQKMLFYLNIEWDYNNTELVANLMMYYISEWLKFYKIIK